MSFETDQLRNPAHRQFAGYRGDAPIWLSDRLHIDQFDSGTYFVAAGDPATFPTKQYLSRDELVAAAKAILHHFGEA